MDAILQQIAAWLKGMLVDGIMNNLSGMFDAVNRQVADVATQVGSTPASFSPGVTGREHPGELFAGGFRPGAEYLRICHHSHRRHVFNVHRLL